MSDTRAEIRQVATEEGWVLHDLGHMDVFTVSPEWGEPLPPMTFLWRGDKKYRPAGGHDDWEWLEDTLTVEEIRERMCVGLYVLCNGCEKRFRVLDRQGNTSLRGW